MIEPKECYNFIHGQEIDWLASGVCSRYRDGYQRVRCVQIIAGKQFNHEGLRICDSYQDLGVNNDCLSIIANRFVQDDAARACNRLRDKIEANGCLRAIAGKAFSDRDVFECDSMSEGYSTTRCFNERGKRDDRYSSLTNPLDELSSLGAQRNEASSVQDSQIRKEGATAGDSGKSGSPAPISDSSAR